LISGRVASVCFIVTQLILRYNGSRPMTLSQGTFEQSGTRVQISLGTSPK